MILVKVLVLTDSNQKWGGSLWIRILEKKEKEDVTTVLLLEQQVLLDLRKDRQLQLL